MLFVRVLAIGSIALIPIAFLSVLIPMGGDAAGAGMASGFLMVGILMFSAAAGLIAFVASFIVRPLDFLTKLLARGPFLLVVLCGGALALSIWLS